MINKPRSALIATTAAVLALSVAAWFFVLQPDRQIDENQIKEWLASGIESYKGKNYEDALATLQLIPPGSSHQAKALYYQGSTHIMLKDYAAAADHLQRALALDSDNSGILYALGVVYYKLGKIKLAKSYFTSVLEINPEDRQAKGLMDIMAKLERQAEPGPDQQTNEPGPAEN